MGKVSLINTALRVSLSRAGIRIMGEPASLKWVTIFHLKRSPYLVQGLGMFSCRVCVQPIRTIDADCNVRFFKAE